MEDEIIERLAKKTYAFYERAECPEPNDFDCLFTALAEHNETEIDRLLALYGINGED